MKVLLVNFKDSGGGAAIAALRLVHALNDAGVEALLAVPKKTSASPYVFELPRKRRGFLSKLARWLSNYLGKILLQAVSPIADRIPWHPFRFATTNGIFHTTNARSECDFDVDWINRSDFDLVNLHWINDVVSNADIARIQKPLVWTMHDSWPCCGAEHHPNVLEGDRRWQEGYYRRNKPATTHGADLCRRVWARKRRLLAGKEIVFTAPSAWERDVLKTSALFGGRRCFLAPNVMDHAAFYPRDRAVVRRMFGIPADRTAIAFGAAGNMDGPGAMKGSGLLIDALRSLRGGRHFLIVFGPVGPEFKEALPVPYFASGYVESPQILACLYSAADVFVNTSIIESFSYTCLEAMSCGVPPVAFDVGGTGCLISHRKDGYLAAPYDAQDVARGIEFCLERGGELAANAVRTSREGFSTPATVGKYLAAYRAALHGAGGAARSDAQGGCDGK